MTRLQFPFVLWATLLCLLSIRSEDIALVGVGDTWKYWYATQQPPADWNGSKFEDTSWLQGDSGFGISTWGENTYFSSEDRGSGTVYFRKEFQVTNPGSIRGLILRCDWQGGFAAYLNGKEVLRRHLSGSPGSPIPFNQESMPRYAGAAEDFLLEIPGDLIQAGSNLLAMEIHPIQGSSYDVVLVPELLANFSRGPYLQSILSDQATVLWRTPTPMEGKVEISLHPDLQDARIYSLTNRSASQEIRIARLEAGTRYYYRVQAGDALSPVESFRTLPLSGDLDFTLVGDSGAGSDAQFKIARQIAQRPSDLLIHLGDVIYPYFTFGQTDTRCLSVYRSWLRSKPAFFTWGNHDLYMGVEPFLAAFRQPTNNTPYQEHLSDKTLPEFYYSFDAGDAHFSILFWPYSSQYFMRENCPQLKWLEADLAASSKPWKFLAIHHPVNTSGGHRLDDKNANGIADRLEVSQRILPLAKKYGVQMIFSGHDHNYERFHPVDGVHSVVSGGGGIFVYGLVERDGNSALFQPRWNFCRVQLRGDQLQLQAIDLNGVVFDALEIRRTRPKSADPDGDGLGPIAEAAANTRPDSPDTDGDGRGDGWEFLNGMDPVHSDFQEDGSHLTDVLSSPFPRLTPQVRVINTPLKQLELHWLGSDGNRVVLESSESMNGPWIAVPGFEQGVPLSKDEQRWSLNSAGVIHFYRVQWVPDSDGVE